MANPYKIHHMQGYFDRPDASDAQDDLITIAEKAQKNPNANLDQVDIGMQHDFVCLWDGPKETNNDAFKAAVQEHMGWEDEDCPWNQD